MTLDAGSRRARAGGDDEHPVSRGYTCSKGRGLAGWHHAPNRLDRPRVRGHECTWDELLADLGSRLDAIIDASGPDAVALYLATGMAYDAAGQIAASTWLPSIASRSFLTAVTPRRARRRRVGDSEPMLNPCGASAARRVIRRRNPSSPTATAALPDQCGGSAARAAAGGCGCSDPRTETAALADGHVPSARRRRGRHLAPWHPLLEHGATIGAARPIQGARGRARPYVERAARTPPTSMRRC